jgi:hypothetical protein
MIYGFSWVLASPTLSALLTTNFAASPSRFIFFANPTEILYRLKGATFGANTHRVATFILFENSEYQLIRLSA